MNHMTIEKLKDEIYEAIKQVNASDEPIYIGEKDKEPEAVLVSLEEFEDMLEAIRIFSDKELYRKAINIINDENSEYVAWGDALKELDLSDDTLDKALENSDIEATLKDRKEGRVETFDSLEDLMKDLNDEDEK